eukprot:2283713-Amphidinium_carterae.1
MQKRLFNIAAQSTPRELGIVLEIIKKQGKRLTPTWDLEAYRADEQRSDSSYSERDDTQIQDLRSQLAKERRRNQELEAMAERAEHHSEMASTISQLMRAFK